MPTPPQPPAPQPSPPVSVRIASSTQRFVERFQQPLLALLLLPVVVGARIAGHRKPLWYDEIFSLIVGLQPTWHRMRLAMPAEANPPLYPILLRICCHFFGITDFVARLPSLLGYLLALVCTFIFIRRAAGALFGLLAVMLVYAQPAWTYSYEARPYALLLGIMTFTLVCWQAAVRPTRPPGKSRAFALTGISLGLVAGIFAHNLGIVIVGFPILLGETVRTLRTRTPRGYAPDWPVLATALPALPAIAITLPMIRATNALLLRYQHNYLHPLTRAKFQHYGVDFPLTSLPSILNLTTCEILAACIAAVWLARIRLIRRARARTEAPLPPGRPAIPAHLFAAALGASLLMPLTWAIMMSTSGYFISRYGIGSTVGFALLTCLLLRQANRLQTFAPLALIAYFAFVFVQARVQTAQMFTIHFPLEEMLYAYPGNLPIVQNDPYRYLESWWYAPESVKPRLYYLTDEQAAVKGGFVIVEKALVAEQPVTTITTMPYDEFLAAHSHFLLNSTGTVNLDFMQRLEAAGYTSTFIARDDYNGPLFDVERAQPSKEK